MTEDKAIERKASFLAYMSDFYFAIGVILLLVATFFMFNEPVGASMLSFDMSVVLVVFAILYVAAVITKEQVLKFLAKYLVLIGFMIVAYQFMIDYGSLSLLQVLFFVSIVVFFVNFVFDVLMYLRDALALVWDMVAKRR